LTLQNATTLTETAVAMWVKGSGELVIRQGSHQVKLDVKQVSNFAQAAETICNDIVPIKPIQVDDFDVFKR